MTVRVTCLGGAVIDLIYGLDDLPARDGKYSVRSLEESGGGMAANAAVTVSRLGGQAIWVGRVGDDDKGRRIIEGLREEGVDMRFAQAKAAATSSHSVVLKDRDGNRAILLYRSDEMEDGASGDAERLPLEPLLRTDVVLADNRWPGGALALLAAARSDGIPTVVDIDSAGDLRALDMARLADYAIYSQPGLEALFEGETLEARLRMAARLSPFAAVTMGAQGVLWCRPDGSVERLPAYEVFTKESVGAGDVFHGAFAFAIAGRQDVAAALRFASAAAALKCAGSGGRRSFPDLAAVADLLERDAGSREGARA